MSLNLGKGRGIEAKRRRQTFFAVNTGDYVSTAGSQVRIEINVDKEVADLETGYLLGDFSAIKSGATDDLHSNPWTASSWMKDLRLYDRSGREIGEQVRQYNALCRKQFEMLGNDGVNGDSNYVGRTEIAGGISALASATIASQEFAHKFITHIFDIKEYFPIQKLGGIVIEIDMEKTANVIHLTAGESTDTLTSYTISNVRYVMDLVKLKPEAEARLDAQIGSGGLEIHYDSYMNHSSGITTNTSQRFDLGIANGHVKSIQAFQVQDVNAASDNRTAADAEYWKEMLQNNLSSYRMKLGSEYLTEKDVQISSGRLSEYLVEYLKSENLDTHDMVHFYGDSNLDLVNNFVIGQKVEISKDPNVSSGVRDLQSNKIELELDFSSAPSAATLYTQVNVDKVLRIRPNREFDNLS